MYMLLGYWQIAHKRPHLDTDSVNMDLTMKYILLVKLQQNLENICISHKILSITCILKQLATVNISSNIHPSLKLHYLCFLFYLKHYSLITFDERVTSWLQQVRLLVMHVYKFDQVMQLHIHTVQQTGTQNTVIRRVKAKRLPSHRSQLKYR